MKTLRLIILLLAAILLIGGFVFVALQPGEIAYTGGPVEITMRPAAFAILALGITLALLMLWWLVGWIWGLPGRMRRAQLEAARKRGLDSLGLALAAFDSGEVSEARRQAQKALGYAPDAASAKLLAAKAAAGAGDPAAAERLFGELTDVAGYGIAARRGLAELALGRGNAASALSHAEAALNLSRKAPWPAEFLFSRRVVMGDWEGALAALDDAEKRGLVGARTAGRRRAVVLSAAAHRAERGGATAAALEMATRAAKLAPGFAPAAVMAARLNKAAGKDWAAAGVIEAAWEQAPHPALALAYRDLKGEADAIGRSRWMDGLVRLNASHRESRILEAESALARGDTLTASGLLDALASERPTSRILTLRAAVAKAAGDVAGARDWLGQAASAAREPDWSDLDPEGAAFAYTDEDWGRMVEAYGDRGVLVHPRHERSDAERLAAPELAEAAASAGAAGHGGDVNGPAVLEGLSAPADEPAKRGWFG